MIRNLPSYGRHPENSGSVAGWAHLSQGSAQDRTVEELQHLAHAFPVPLGHQLDRRAPPERALTGSGAPTIPAPRRSPTTPPQSRADRTPSASGASTSGIAGAYRTARSSQHRRSVPVPRRRVAAIAGRAVQSLGLAAHPHRRAARRVLIGPASIDQFAVIGAARREREVSSDSADGSGSSAVSRSETRDRPTPPSAATSANFRRF